MVAAKKGTFEARNFITGWILIMYRLTKLRWRRKVRRHKQKVEDLGDNAGEQFEKHFIRRIIRLDTVRRFVIGWLLLIIMLSGVAMAQTRSLNGYFQHPKPIPGGTYTEGVVGRLTNTNPLFTSTAVDATVSKLVFSGLLRFNEENKLVNDLAESWELDKSDTVYTVKLRRDIVWHDGEKITADDVVFTFRSAQNPDVKSSLFHTWREVRVAKVDDTTVQFKLKAPFAPFIYSLTTGIIPRHLLNNVEPSQLRSASFNTNHPVGSGPFVWQTLELSENQTESQEQHIGLAAYDLYHLGTPRLENFVVKAYQNKEQALKAFRDRQVDALSGLDELPEDLDQDVYTHETPTTALQMAFFSTNNGVLKDVNLRKALVYATNAPLIIEQLGYPVIKADQPFLKSSFAYNSKLKQPPQHVPTANKLLDEAGWNLKEDGRREQNDTNLNIKLLGQNDHENSVIAKGLQQAWTAVGVKTDVILLDGQDFQAAIANRDYDVLLNAISIGADPDIYAFWHSSQADRRAVTRLNFSSYSSKIADQALEAGRSRVDSALRAAKYKPFSQAWQKDNPALALYQPRYLYVTRGQLFFYNPKQVNASTDRLNNVHNWMIRQAGTPIVD